MIEYGDIRTTMKQTPLERDIYKKRFASEVRERYRMWAVLCGLFFQRFVSENDTVLDLASGYGEFINNIKCKKKIACDINPDTKQFLNTDVQFFSGLIDQNVIER